MCEELLLNFPHAKGSRIPARCSHFPVCGGCKWQDVEYGEQLQRKQTLVEEAFGPICDLSRVFIGSILPASSPWRYRNKMEFTFSQNRAGEHFLGLIIAGSRGHVLNLEECHLTSPWFIEVVKSMRSWWKTTSLKAYHRYSNTGSLRTLTLREGIRTQEKMAILTVSGHPDFALSRAEIAGYVEAIKACGEASIFLCIQQLTKGSPTQFFEMHLAGKDHINERLEIGGRAFTFKISPRSFFQPNTLQAEQLYQKAQEMVSPEKKRLILDLYCGTATLGMSFAHLAEQVIGIELSPEAILDAESNLHMNNIHNVTLHSGDVAVVLKREKIELPDLIIVDPPRCGLMDDALQQILALSPAEILYISCNPETQAKNVKTFQESGYLLTAFQPVDQFPHTQHIENIAVLKRR